MGGVDCVLNFLASLGAGREVDYGGYQLGAQIIGGVIGLFVIGDPVGFVQQLTASTQPDGSASVTGV
ncbi:MAG TPA: hypothetical protein VLE70_11625 [Anaerolineae bacterium]|nr:hypothetical protein [Anaerolineae bacterium]